MKEHAAPLAAGVTLALLGWVAGPPLWRRIREQRQRRRLEAGAAGASDATLLYHQLLEALEERQIRKPAWFTPREFAEKLPPSELAGQVAAFTSAYNRLRFGGDAAAAGEMLTLIDRIRSAP